MQQITVKRVCEAEPSTFLDDDAYDHLITGDADVYKDNGEVLLKFRANILSDQAVDAAYRNLRAAAVASDNRGMAGGKVDPDKANATYRNAKKKYSKDGTRYVPMLKSGEWSKTLRANEVNSGLVGYFDRYPRIPYCRQTAYNLKYPGRFKGAAPFFQEVSQVFKDLVPERFEAQAAYIRLSSPDFYIPDTVFTTVTVNRNWQTAVHKDAGDLESGFGCMSAFDSGNFEGCYLCFPEFRVAVDIGKHSVMCSDVHEWHGNTPFHIRGKFERVSTVLYYREGIKECGSNAYELERAKKHGANIRNNGGIKEQVTPAEQVH